MDEPGKDAEATGTGQTGEDDDPTERRGRDYVPKGVPRETGLWPTLKRTALEFQEDILTDWAATLTYYGLLALFPALIVLVSLVGLLGDPQSTTDTLTDVVTKVGPDSAASTFAGPIQQVTESRSTAGFALIISTLIALWSASGYLGAFIRASNVIYETREGRPFWKLRPLQLVLTLVVVILLAVMAIGVVLTGPIVSDVARARPAGRIFRHRGHWIRPSQDCSHGYGGAVVFNRIERLTIDEYRETPIARVDPTWAARLAGTHTYNAAGSIEVIDGMHLARRFRLPLGMGKAA